MNREQQTRHAAKVAEAAAYGRSIGRNTADYYLYGLASAEDAREILALARRGELAEALGADPGRVSAGELARDLGVRRGTRLAAAMHEAMTAAWGPAFYDRALSHAMAAAGILGDPYA